MTVVAGAEQLQVGSSVIRPEVRLPVGGEQQPPHASSSAATPGSGLPSRNSSEAPPPVETWVSLSARDRKSTRLNSSHGYISYAVFCLKKKKNRRIMHECHSTTAMSS